MSDRSKSTAVFPSNYYFQDLQDIDPRFYVEKDFVIVVPDDAEESVPTQEAIVYENAEEAKTLRIIQDVDA